MAIDVRTRLREITNASALASFSRSFKWPDAAEHERKHEELVLAFELEIKALEEKAWQYESLCK